MKPYSTTAQVLNQAIAALVSQSGWNVSDPGTVDIQDITYTALPVSRAAPITVVYIPGGTAGAEIINVSGSAISVRIQSGVSTATQILVKINASAAALALVFAEITGTAGTAQISTSAPVDILGDVVLRIMEADNEIDTRLAGMGVTLPLASNPPILRDISVLYARAACLRDMYTGANPQANSESAKVFMDQFEKKWEQLRTGWKVLLDAAGTPISASKFTPMTAQYPETEMPPQDRYPNYPLGPYPDPAGVDGN